MKNSRYILLLTITLLLPALCVAQFRYKSEIPDVKQSGYYHILLSSDVLSAANDQLSDIRLKDEKGEEIPYILRVERGREEESSFEYFTLTENEYNTTDSAVHVIIDNNGRNMLCQFCITMRAADVQKHITISGSDDGKMWYIVKQKTTAPLSIGSPEAGRETMVVNFPEGNYRYYKMVINAAQGGAIQVESVGKYKYTEVLGKYTEIPLAQFSQKDSSNKKTYLYFHALDKSYFVDKMYFEVAYRSFYKRTASLMSRTSDYPVFRSFELLFDNPNTVWIGAKVDSSMVIEIENNDNPPLAISGITIFQLHRHLTVYLEEGKHYTLYYGENQPVVNPAYDLVHFEEKIPKNLPVLELGEAQAIDQQTEVQKAPSFFERPLFLWLVIGVVGALLLWMCYQILRKK